MSGTFRGPHSVFRVYLAGPMNSDPSLDERTPTEWRQAIIKTWKQQFDRRCPVEFLCPEFVGRPHDGYAPTVEADLQMINTSSLVLACIDSPEREGTFIEMGYAHGKGIPVVGLYRCFSGPGELEWGSFSANLCEQSQEYQQFDNDFSSAACSLIILALADHKLKGGFPTLGDIQTANRSLELFHDKLYPDDVEKEEEKTENPNSGGAPEMDRPF